MPSFVPVTTARGRVRVTAMAVAILLLVGLGAWMPPATAIAAGAASITGTITREGTPATAVQSAMVLLYGADGSWHGAAFTAANGGYAFSNLAPGSYTVKVSGANGSQLVTEWWNNRAEGQEASRVALAAGQSATGTNVELALGATISGTVAEATAGSVQVQAVTTDPRTRYTRSFYGVTDDRGNYTLGGLPGGSYTLYFESRNGAARASAWWGLAPSHRQAQFFTVYDRQVVAGKNIALPVGASIAGTLTNPQGGTPSGSVVVYEAGGAVDDLSTHVRTVPTDADGRYTVTGLLPGSYKVGSTTGSAGADFEATGALPPATANQAGWYPARSSYAASETVVISAPGQKRVDINGSLGASTAVGRIAGADRYAVAAAISREGFPGTAPVVYITKGTDFPDALSAAPAAAKQGGPLLLTHPDGVPRETRDEIARLRPGQIVVVGGEASVTPRAIAELNGLVTTDAPVKRLAGADRYAASRAVVEYAFGYDGVQQLYLATGSNFPDALSASAAAGANGDAVLLVNGAATGIDAATRKSIGMLRPTVATIAGGPASVSTGIETAVGALGLPDGVYRLGGADRFAASQAINADGFDGASEVFIATGYKFPDALAGAVLAATRGAPLYVVPPHCVPAAMLADIRGYEADTITLLGGEASLSLDVQQLVACGG
ncbi:cell wall-binding repeat-containing protein [Marisediminicola senii]|uniref:cell wall-binding repeat-containing protein n=1 Tax=Marisediminicola senii TaxID=2711233 RepID=UPI0013ECCE14|nr:cell wall-binding repeat-containing protein [Marisediminicola senii]